MPTLYEELQPLAVAVDKARTAVVDAARHWVGAKGTVAGEEDLRAAVGNLDKAQMALGLKTSQLLLARPRLEQTETELRGALVKTGHILDPAPPPGPPPRPANVGTAWTKKKE